MNGMGWDVMGVIAVGIGAAAVLYALRHALGKAGRSMAPWVLPGGIGLAMISFAIWNEYSWFPRVTDQLPPTMEVLVTGAGGKAWRPWSFVIPVTTRFSALDRAEVTTVDNQQRARIFLVERWARTMTLTLAVDCDAGKQGLVNNAGQVNEWRTADPADPVVVALCKVA